MDRRTVASSELTVAKEAPTRTAGGTSGPLGLPALLKTLREKPPTTGKVLSVYLDTSPGQIDRQAYLLAYRDLCKNLRQQLPPSEHAAFETAAQQAEGYLTTAAIGHAPGLALFASDQPGYFAAASLPARPRDELVWDLRPRLEPAQAMLDDYERVAVVLFDTERARLFTVYLGELEEHLTIHDHVTPKQQSGGWAALSQSKFARHHDAQLLQHARHTSAALMAMLRSHSVDRMLVGGPEEALAVLLHQLPPPLRRRLDGTFRLELFASDAAVLRAVQPLLAASERRAEVAEIDELLNVATSAQVVLGIEPTLAALAEGRVHALYLADFFGGVGGECENCGRLVPGPGPCPRCGGTVIPVADLGDRAMEQAVAQGARVDVVSGDAAARLAAQGGIGAWTRY